MDENDSHLPTEIEARGERVEEPATFVLTVTRCSRSRSGSSSVELLPRSLVQRSPAGRTTAGRATCASSETPHVGEGVDLVDALVRAGLPFPQARDKLVDEFEQRFVEHLLEQHGDAARAAKASGIGLRYFQKLRARAGR